MPSNSSDTERNSVNSTCFPAAPVVAFCLLMVHLRNLPPLCNALLQQSLCNLQIYFLYHSSPAMFWDRDCIDRVNIWTVVLYFYKYLPPFPLFLSVVTRFYLTLSSYLEKILQGRQVIFYKTRSHRCGIKSTKHLHTLLQMFLLPPTCTHSYRIFWGESGSGESAMLIYMAHTNTPQIGR